MKKILITGSRGFIGLNLVNILKNLKDYTIIEYNSNNSIDELKLFLKESDIIFHLAAINRNDDNSEFYKVNVELTQFICSYLIKINRNPMIIFSSSTQAGNNSIYGKSKLEAEEIIKEYRTKTNSEVSIYRLPGVFGKWSKPNYNTVIATFCYNISRDLPIQINNENSIVDLVYIDDVINQFINDLNFLNSKNDKVYKQVVPEYSVSLGELSKKIQSFKESRKSLRLGDYKDTFSKKLQATYLSFIPRDKFAYQLPKNKDDRGVLAEFLKSESLGQIFVSSTKPGYIRGNHYHNTKVEKFLVLSGRGVIKFKNIIKNDGIISYEVEGKDYKVLDIPPGYTHSIENTGDEEMIVLFWSSEIYNPELPDTEFYPLES